MEMKEKIKIRLEIAKFKVLYFAGVLGAASFLINSYEKIVIIFGHPKLSNYTIAILIVVLIGYGVAGIVKNIRILSNIDERMKNER